MLYIHDRNQRAGPVDAVASDALRHAFFNEHRSTEYVFRARALLRELHRDRLWLSCDCAGDGESSPMLGPRDGRGGLHPFRFGAIKHDPACPFAADINRSSTDTVDDLLGPIHGSWDLEQMVPAAATHEARGQALLRLLKTALFDLGFNRVHASAFHNGRRGAPLLLVDRPYTRLRHLGTKDMGHGVSFAEVGCTFLPGINRTYASLRALASKSGRPNVVGLFIGITEESVPPVRGGSGYLKAKDAAGEQRVIPVLGDIHLPPGDSGSRGPYWTIGLIERAGERQSYRLMEAASMAASDRRTLLPLSDGRQRPVVQLLLEQMQFWRNWKRLELEVELELPLFPCAPGEPRPVALVLDNGRQITISFQDGGKADMQLGHDVVIDDALRRRLTAAVAAASELA